MQIDSKAIAKYVGIAILALFVLIGAIASYHTIQSLLAKPTQPTTLPANAVVDTNGKQSSALQPLVVHVQGENTTTREIQYVEKQTDPNTGQLEKTGLEVNTKQGKVYIKVNGVEYEIPAKTTADGKVVDGKFIMDEQTTTSFAITTPKQLFRVGPGVNPTDTKDWSIHMSGELSGVVGWWGMVAPSHKAGYVGLDFPLMGNSKQVTQGTVNSGQK